MIRKLMFELNWLTLKMGWRRSIKYTMPDGREIGAVWLYRNPSVPSRKTGTARVGGRPCGSF